MLRRKGPHGRNGLIQVSGFKFQVSLHPSSFRRHTSPLAPVAELADAQDLGSCAARRGGSSPPGSTTLRPAAGLRVVP